MKHRQENRRDSHEDSSPTITLNEIAVEALYDDREMKMALRREFYSFEVPGRNLGAASDRADAISLSEHPSDAKTPLLCNLADTLSGL